MPNTGQVALRAAEGDMSTLSASPTTAGVGLGFVLSLPGRVLALQNPADAEGRGGPRHPTCSVLAAH